MGTDTSDSIFDLSVRACPLCVTSMAYLRVGIVIVVFTLTCVDDQRRGLTRHSEATSVDTVVFGEFDFRAIHGGGGYLALSRRDADLHLVILVQTGARGYSITILGDSGGANARPRDCQCIGASGLLTLLTLTALLTLTRASGVTTAGDSCGTRTALTDGQRIALRLLILVAALITPAEMPEWVLASANTFFSWMGM